MLQNKYLLQNSKNLLAFSAGVDSTALFFLLLQEHISFDIAIVDYGLREQSLQEVAYAQALAKEYNLTCHLYKAPQIDSNFEAKARTIRYEFFEELIEEYHYTNLLTAHHLGDRFEWMLMQLCKGAGCLELRGMQAVESRKKYQLLRPLLHLQKEELLHYLRENKLTYFEDSSNYDEKYTRNYFRQHHSNPLLKNYAKGIAQSFKYIDKDAQELVQEISLQSINQLIYFKAGHMRSNIVAMDKYFKSIGKLLTAHEKNLLEHENSVVIARKYIVTREANFIFIAPYLQVDKIDKKLKEKFRLLKIAPKLRGYLSTDADAVTLVSLLLE